MLSRFRCLIAIVLFCALCERPHASAQNGAGDVANLSSKDGKVRADAQARILDERRATIRSLLRVVEKKDGWMLPNGAMVRAVRLLGQLRASEAVDTLVSVIDYTPLIVRERTGFPVAYALIEIGKPASRKALLRLRTERNSTRCSLLVQVLKQVEGEHVAIYFIKSELTQKNLTPKAKENLQSAMRELTGRESNKAVERCFKSYTPTWKSDMHR